MLQRFTIKPAPLDAGGKPFGLDPFVRWLCATDRRFSRNGAGLRARLRIEKAVTEQASAPVLVLEQPDWALVRDAAENPTAEQYPAEPAAAFVRFLDALGSAATEPPRLVASGEGEPPAPAAAAPKRGRRKKA